MYNWNEGTFSFLQIQNQPDALKNWAQSSSSIVCHPVAPQTQFLDFYVSPQWSYQILSAW